MDLAEATTLTGFSHIQLRVSDLDASVAWYQEVLGLEQVRGEAGRYATLQGPDGRLRVVLSQGAGVTDGVMDHIAFTVASLDALTTCVARFTSLGVRHDGIKPNAVAGHSLDLHDPDGINIELVTEA